MSSASDTRNVRKEIELLVNTLGMSEKEAYDTLGLLPPDEEPLLQETCETNTTSSPADILMDMFPNIALSTIEDALEETDQSVDQASDLLLNYELLNEASAQESGHLGTQESVKKRNWAKQVRKMRKASKKDRKLLDHEETDIKVISSSLNISDEDARELYWTHGNDMTTAIMARMPSVPLTTRLAAEQKVKDHIMKKQMLQPVASPISQRSATPLGVTEYTSLPYNELRRKIDAVSSRISALQESQRAHKNNHLTTSRVSDVSLEMRDLKEELRLLNLSMTAQDKLGRHINRIIDLHGYTLDEAKAVTEEAIRVFMKSNEQELELVSGAGRHSRKGKAVIKEWLRTYLRSQNLKVTETEGSFVVRHRMRM